MSMAFYDRHARCGLACAELKPVDSLIDSEETPWFVRTP